MNHRVSVIEAQFDEYICKHTRDTKRIESGRSASVCDDCIHLGKGTCPLPEDYMWEVRDRASECMYFEESGDKHDPQ